ncbi:MFS transporter [Blastococcus mobilis]|uniref:Sugar transporter n=1 Tax=Blastococcus mobilis TaxID=1938746 RepID=A0A239AAQ9_9ACTN|nr:MFS transporter [Blastococcus mobilis]SNR92421.1 Sugar transporter [Blastococcus mobilis]
MTAPSSTPVGATTTDLDVAALQRRTLRVLLASQVLAGAGLAAGVTVGALLAEDMLGSTGLSGLPAALLTLGSAAAAVGVGRISQRSGRRPGLAAGYFVGAVGGAGVVLAAAIDSVPLLLVSLLLYGSGTATNLQARYAGADLAAPQRRGRAVSTVLVATTLGAVAGPNLVEPMGAVAAALGIPELAGPFILATVAYALAGVVVSLTLRPDPLVTARAIADEAARAATAGPDSRTDTARLRLGATAMIVTQLVMVALMTMTPVHMRDHGHALGAAGLVISLHIAAMFLPSPVTGRLVDRYGRRPLIAAAGVTLLAAGLLAATAPPDSVVLLAGALILLGLGWNLGLVAGTALLTDAVRLQHRARTQGTVDLGVALAGATGGIGSGLIVAATSFAALGLAGGLVALALVPSLLVSRSRAAAAEPATAGRSA